MAALWVVLIRAGLNEMDGDPAVVGGWIIWEKTKQCPATNLMYRRNTVNFCDIDFICQGTEYHLFKKKCISMEEKIRRWKGFPNWLICGILINKLQKVISKIKTMSCVCLQLSPFTLRVCIVYVLNQDYLRSYLSPHPAWGPRFELPLGACVLAEILQYFPGRALRLVEIFPQWGLDLYTLICIFRLQHSVYLKYIISLEWNWK